MAFFKLKNAEQMDKAIKHWKAAADQGLEAEVLDATEETAQYYLRRLRQNAHKAGKDWGQAADQAYVERLETNVVVKLPYAAHDMEYGTEGEQPRAVVRQTTTQMEPYLKGYFNKQLKIRLFGTGDS